MTNKVTNAGFIGLGNIGKPIANCLMKGDFGVWVYDVFPEAADELVEAGANKAESVAQIAEHCEVVELCVRNDDDVKDVMGQILASPGKVQVVAILSTVRPETIKEQSALAASQNIAVIDAPISGGASGAQNGTLVYMVGGDADTLEICRPVFETSAREIIHAGDLGMGMTAKLCNNMMTYAQFITYYESTRLAEAAGLSPEVLKAVGAANGNITEQMSMFIVLKDFKPGFSEEDFENFAGGFAAVAEKDLSIALEQAKVFDETLPSAEKSLELIGKVYRDNY